MFRCPEKRKGWGVRCIDDLQAGTFVIDYVGEVGGPQKIRIIAYKMK